jgi:hypothetical protein
MKKKSQNPKVIVLIVIALMVILLSVYAFVANSARQQKEQSLSTVDVVMSRDLELDYPGTPKEVLSYYNSILDCFYNQDCTQDQLIALGGKARTLFDRELQEANEPQDYLERLLGDVEKFKDQGMKIPSTSVSSAISVEKYTKDGYSFAKLSCTYDVKEGKTMKPSSIIYLFRLDDNRKWKIFGWELANTQSEAGE